MKTKAILSALCVGLLLPAAADVVAEPARTLPVIEETDVLVVGGGFAAAAAADGAALGAEVLRTAGAPVRVVLTPERAYGSLQVVRVTLVDADGNFVPDDCRRIFFRAEGCEIVAVGNSDPRGYDSFKDVSSHPLCLGRAAVYVRIADACATLRASADGLDDGEVRLK